MSMSMSARFNVNDELTVTYYSYDDDFDDNDFYRTLTFSVTETAKLQKLLGVNEAQELQRVIDHRFGHDFYKRFFDDFCKANDIHFHWFYREDYPGGTCEEGEA